MIFGLNTTCDISKLSQISLAKRLVKLRITILKYHSRYLCQISLQIMLLPILINIALSNLLCDYYKKQTHGNMESVFKLSEFCDFKMVEIKWQLNFIPWNLYRVIAWFVVIFGINTTSDISKLLYVISRAVRQVNFETILKYHQ